MMLSFRIAFAVVVMGKYTRGPRSVDMFMLYIRSVRCYHRTSAWLWLVISWTATHTHTDAHTFLNLFSTPALSTVDRIIIIITKAKKQKNKIMECNGRTESFLKSIHSVPQCVSPASRRRALPTWVAASFRTIDVETAEWNSFWPLITQDNNTITKPIRSLALCYWQRAYTVFKIAFEHPSRTNYILFIFSHSWVSIYLSPASPTASTHSHMSRRYRSTAAESFASKTFLFLSPPNTNTASSVWVWCNLDLGQVTFFASTFFLSFARFFIQFLLCLCAWNG